MKSSNAKYEKLRRLRKRLWNMAQNKYEKYEAAHTKKLQNAVVKFIASLGGDVAVIGPAQIWHWPSDGSLNFHVALKCTGTEPGFLKRKQGVE